jgi:hypothetical protein
MTSRSLGVLVVILATLGVCASCEVTRSPLEEACARRGRLALVGSVTSPRCGDTELVAATSSLRAALGEEEATDATRALRASRATGMLVALDATARGRSVGARLARAEPVDGLRTLVVAPGLTFVEPDVVPELTERESWALAEVARRVLTGTTPPVLSQFPQTLRAPVPVEVMILVREHGNPIFWRSARGGSIASALLLALSVSRARWADRASVLRGSIEERVPRLDVEVWLLAEDGTYSERDQGLIDATVNGHHGVGYESRAGWFYELPERLRGKRGVEAFEQLFEANALDEHAFDRLDLRLYRFRATRLARSAPEPLRIPGPPSPGLIQAGDSL